MTDLLDFQDKWETLVDRDIAGTYHSLSSDERVWLNVQYLTNSIGNGGLISYYYNSPADTIEDCIEALESIGAIRLKELVQRMNSFFPEGVPKDITARNDIISAWPDGDHDFNKLIDEIEEAASLEAKDAEIKLVKFIEMTGIGF